MTDVTTHKPLYVEIESAGPLLTVPVCQLDQIRQLLDRHGIRLGRRACDLAFPPSSSPPSTPVPGG